MHPVNWIGGALDERSALDLEGDVARRTPHFQYPQACSYSKSYDLMKNAHVFSSAIFALLLHAEVQYCFVVRAMQNQCGRLRKVVGAM
jgi:hypothetical protein